MSPSRVLDNARTQEVERLVAELAAKPLLQENVFFSARYADGASEKEVADIIVAHSGEALVVSVKASDKQRTPKRHADWLAKHAAKALKQLQGAYRTVRERDFWCEHPVLGRREFRASELRVVHGVSLLESQGEVCVDVDRKLFASVGTTCPVSMLAIDDFINVVMRLRTWRDMVAYLTSRATSLRDPDVRLIGAERYLFAFYTANRDSFAGCLGVDDARIVAASGKLLSEHSARREQERALAQPLEDVMQNLGGASDSSLFGGAAASPLAAADERRRALREELCDLTMQERAGIGEQIAFVSKQALDTKTPVCATVRMGRLPDRIYLVLVGAEQDREGLLHQGIDLTIQACIFYRRSRGVLIAVGRDARGDYFHVSRVDNVQPSVEMTMAAEASFGGSGPRRIAVAR